VDTLEAIRRRRTIRKYRSDPVDPEALTRILEAGRHAPSGANRQPWRFYVVDDPEAKAEIRGHCEAADRRWHQNAPAWLKAFFDQHEIQPEKPYLTDAPHLICVFAERGNPYWRESAWIAVGYMTLQATAEGLASVTYTPGQTRHLNRTLGVPDEFLPICILPIGHPAEAPSADLRPRRPLEETAHRVREFRRADAEADASERPAPYGSQDGAHIPTLMDNQEALAATLAITRLAGTAGDPAAVAREALPILGRLVRADASAIGLGTGDAPEMVVGDASLLAPGRASGPTQEICVPLEIGGRRCGLLALRRESGAGFTHPELELLAALSGLVALALEHAELRAGPDAG